jgi:hypothetical protein
VISRRIKLHVPEKRHIYGTKGDTEVLDDSYKVRNRDNQDFFRPGRVFSTLWTDHYSGAANANDSENDQFMSRVTYVIYKQKVHSKIRRFVVVRLRDRCCQCLPVTSYDGRGLRKIGINLDEHGLIYGGDKHSSRIEGITKAALKVKLSKGAEKLKNPSLINYGRVYSVETNVKVKDVGDLDSDSKKLLRRYFNEVNFALDDDIDGTAPPHDPQQRAMEFAGISPFRVDSSDPRYLPMDSFGLVAPLDTQPNRPTQIHPFYDDNDLDLSSFAEAQAATLSRRPRRWSASMRLGNTGNGRDFGQDAAPWLDYEVPNENQKENLREGAKETKDHHELHYVEATQESDNHGRQRERQGDSPATQQTLEQPSYRTGSSGPPFGRLLAGSSHNRKQIHTQERSQNNYSREDPEKFAHQQLRDQENDQYHGLEAPEELKTQEDIASEANNAALGHNAYDINTSTLVETSSQLAPDVNDFLGKYQQEASNQRGGIDQYSNHENPGLKGSIASYEHHKLEDENIIQDSALAFDAAESQIKDVPYPITKSLAGEDTYTDQQRISSPSSVTSFAFRLSSLGMSQSSMTSIIDQPRACDRLVDFLYGDKELNRLYNDALEKVTYDVFETHFRNSLLLFAAQLRLEATSREGKETARIIQTFSRNAAHTIRNMLQTKRGITEMADYRSEEPDLDWEGDARDEEELVPIDDADGETDPLQLLEQFVQASESLKLLKEAFHLLIQPDPIKYALFKAWPVTRSRCFAYEITCEIEWELPQFPQRNFSEGQIIDDVLTLTGDSLNAQSLSCKEYLSFMWPKIGPLVLSGLNKYFQHRSEGKCEMYHHDRN